MNHRTTAQTKSQPIRGKLQASGILRRNCDRCQIGGPIALHNAANSNFHQVPSIVYEVLRSPGQPLDSSSRLSMESHFNRSLSAVNTPQITLRDTPNHLRIGREDDYLEQEANSMANIEIHPPIEQIERHNLSNVRIHSDAMAAESARTIHAAAYSVGHNIVFGPGQYEPNSSIGKKLLAHELAHVIQYEHSANLMDPEENITRRTHSSNDLSVIHRRVAECGYQASQLIEEGGKQSDSSQVPAPPRGLADKDYEEISEELHNAMAGLGTDEEGVYFALNRLKRDPKAIDLLMKKYEAKYKINLLEQIYDEFSGTELEYALQLLNAGKKGSAQEVKDATPTSEENWKNAADRLNKAFEGWGTDEEAVYAVLTPFHRKMELLVKLKLIYKDRYKESLRARIEDEMSGFERDYALWLLGEQPLNKHDAKAESQANEVLEHIKNEAEKRAKATHEPIAPSSRFYNVLRDRYLTDYFSNPTAETGRKAAEEEIGRQMEGIIRKVNNILQVWVHPRGTDYLRLTYELDLTTLEERGDKWEFNAIKWLNKQELPPQIKNMKDLDILKHLQNLPTELGAATDILIQENTGERNKAPEEGQLPYIDVPFLIGKPNPDTSDINADVRGGGKNISQLMHWATGVKYSKQSPEALRELFLAYEVWHLEGWDVFGQDAINDLIAENQGRMLGAELLKGSAGAIKTEADLLPFLNRSFMESRAWVGTLLRMRQAELDNWILSKQQKQADIHWTEKEENKEDIWPSLTIYQMLADKMPIDEVKKSFMVESAIEIYTLIYEAIEWERMYGPIKLTSLEKALVEGKLDDILSIMARRESGEVSKYSPKMLKAWSAIRDLEGIK